MKLQRLDRDCFWCGRAVIEWAVPGGGFMGRTDKEYCPVPNAGMIVLGFEPHLYDQADVKAHQDKQQAVPASAAVPSSN